MSSKSRNIVVANKSRFTVLALPFQWFWNEINWIKITLQIYMYLVQNFCLKSIPFNTHHTSNLILIIIIQYTERKFWWLIKTQNYRKTRTKKLSFLLERAWWSWTFNTFFKRKTLYQGHYNKLKSNLSNFASSNLTICMYSKCT